MKSLAKTSLLALAGLALASQAATAAITYTQGDLLLGIRNGTSQELVFDLGSYLNYRSSSASSSVNIAADLTTAFGGTWNTLTTLQWNVIGYTNWATPSIVVGRPEATVGTNVTGWNNLATANSNKAALGVYNVTSFLANAYDSDTTTITNGAMTAPADTTSAYWTNEAAGTATGISNLSFGVFDPVSFETVTGKTLANTAVDLFQLNNTGAGQGAIQGTFTISNAGDLSFQAVPEPSTYAMTAIGGIGFLGLLRRRSIKA